MMNDAADSPDDSRIFETFMRYPAPLAVVDLQGRIELTNKAFADYLRRGDIDPKSLMALSGEGHTGDGTWRHLPARDAGVAPVCRARAVRTRQRILVVVQAIGDDGEASAGDSFELRLEELAHLAPTDPVTGAWTRAHLDHVIGAEIARSDTSRSALSLVLIGVDSHAHIRQANGPAASDALLRELVGLLKARMRSSDLLFRRDEQTFVALASSAGYQGAQIMAETLRRAVAEQGFDSGQTLTVSAAVAEHLEGESVQAWFGRLDRLLDEARNAGGNRVAVDRHGMQPGTAGHAASLHLVWHPDCESGNALIDREHRQLYDLANAVIDAALAEPIDSRKFNAAFKALFLQAQQHFADEEEILERYCYAHLPEQRRSHAGLLQRARRLQEMAEAGQASPGSIVEFLAQDLVARHLRIVDRGFFALFDRGGD